MATKRRLTRRQIREDRFVTNLLRAQEYLTEHAARFIMGAVGIVVVAAVVFFLVRSSQAKEQEANEILGRATVELRSRNYQMATVDYQKILDDYSGTDAAKFASFYIANAYFELKNYDQAREYFRMHIDKYRVDDMLTASALAGIAHCHRARNEMKEAGDVFYEVYDKYPKSYVASDCLYLAVRSYAAAGDSAAALELWDIIDKLPGQSQQAMELQQYLVEKEILDPTVSTYD